MKSFAVLSCLAVIALVSSALAAEPEFKIMDIPNFAAPSVPSTSSLTNQPIGTIVFDHGTGQFFGLDGAGNWDPFNYTGGSVVLSSGSQLMNTVSFAENTACTTTCAINQQSGGWVAQVARLGTGQYQVDMNITYPQPPTCTVSAYDGIAVLGDGVNGNSYVIVNTYDLSGTATDLPNVNVICAGQQP